MIKRYKYRVYPTAKQEVNFQKTFGCCRFVYNWALRMKNDDYEKKKDTKEKTLSCYDISKLLTQLKKEEEYKWLNNAPSTCFGHVLNHLDLAYKNFFRRVKRGETPGFPKFKKKYGSQKVFAFHQGYRIDFDKGYMTVPKFGKLKVVFHREFDGIYKTSTIMQEPSGKYYVSIVVDDLKEGTNSAVNNNSELLGCDHGVINNLTLSNGRRFNIDLNFEKEKKRIVKLSRNLARKKVKSNNFRKNKIALAKIHERIRFRREYLINNLLCDLALYLTENNYAGIVIRKYDIKSMTAKNKPIKEGEKYKRNKRFIQKRVNEKILNASMGMVFTKAKVKLKESGLIVEEIDASEEATTKKCSKCGEKELIDISLRTRTIACKNCGKIYDIDYNAAKNTKQIYLENFETQEVTV